jgi:hypothetical protein
MKTSLLASALLAAVLPAAALAGPKEDVAAAAKKLSEAEGYSWTTTTEMGGGNGGGGGGGGRNFRPGPVEGKTLKSGVSLITMKFGDNTVETFTKDGKSVTKRDGAWKTPQELAAERSGDGGGNGGGRGRGGFGGMGRNMKTPAEQAAETASKVDKFEEKDGALTGTLSPEAVKGLLTFGGGRRPGGGGGDGGNRPEPKDTSGTVTYWLKDGAIAKVETHVKGTISANGEDRQIDRKTTTEFSAVGSTKLEVPEEVTKKLAEAKAPE